MQYVNATIGLGNEIARWFDRRPVTIECSLPVEFDPDDVFRAMNRIETLIDDLNGLDTNWQQKLRVALDDADAPSMSVGDTITVVTRHDTLVWTCRTTGWDNEGWDAREIVMP